MRYFCLNKALTFVFTLITILLITSCANSTINTRGKLTAELKANKICFIAGTPSEELEYSFVKRIKFGKGSYGKVDEVTVNLADQARVIGADAIINYEGSQRFGFWPWRLVRPIVRGDAIKWSDPQSINCSDLGGVLH